MTLINTDGMAFIGPGSEWFWTALTGIVLAVTFIALYRQSWLQAHATALEQVQWFEREGLGSELTQQMWLEVLYSLRDGTDPADLPDPAAGAATSFWETFANLARTGHRDPKLLWRVDPTSAQVVWAMLTPWVHKRRARYGNPAIFENLEWLAGVMAEMDRRAGRPPVTPADLTRDIDSEIAYRQERIRAAQALRTVNLAQPVAVTLAQPVAVTITRPAPAE